MSLELIAPLKVVWDFIGPLLRGRLETYLKPAEIGKRRSFELYQLLERVGFESQAFVGQLSEFVLTMEAHPTLEEQEQAKI